MSGVGLPSRTGGCLCGAVRYAAGTLDDSSGLTIVCPIFTADKGGYYEISDAAPQLRDGSFTLPWP